MQEAEQGNIRYQRDSSHSTCPLRASGNKPAVWLSTGCDIYSHFHRSRVCSNHNATWKFLGVISPDISHGVIVSEYGAINIGPIVSCGLLCTPKCISFRMPLAKGYFCNGYFAFDFTIAYRMKLESALTTRNVYKSGALSCYLQLTLTIQPCVFAPRGYSVLCVFEVKLTFKMLTVCGQQHSFSTHERVFL